MIFMWKGDTVTQYSPNNHDLKTQLAVWNKFVSRNDNNDKRVVYTQSENVPTYATKLACQTWLKKTYLDSEVLTDTVMLLIVENGMRGRIYYLIKINSKASNEYIKSYDK